MKRIAATLLAAPLALAGVLALPATGAQAASARTDAAPAAGVRSVVAPQSTSTWNCSYTMYTNGVAATCSNVPSNEIWQVAQNCAYWVGTSVAYFPAYGRRVTGNGTSEANCGLSATGTSSVGIVDDGTVGSSGSLVGYGSKCVDVQNGRSTVATHVDLYDCNGAFGQWWTFAGDGTVHSLGLCLNVVNGSNVNGNHVEIYTCSSSSNSEKWTRQADGSLKNVLTGKCLDDLGFNTANGTWLGIWDCNGAANQKWTLTS